MATRLRHALPRGVQMGRLGADVFLLLIRRSPGDDYLLDVAKRVRDRLARPVTLGRGDRPSEVHLGAHEWVADFGIGVVSIVLEANRAAGLNSARAMSRTALTYPSRIAQFSKNEQEVVEALPRRAVA